MDLGTCRWFILCENEATTTRDAGPVGQVPICQRCDEKIERLDAETRRP